jgi:hypothetical protein
MLRIFSFGLLLVLAAMAGFFIPRLVQYPGQAQFAFKFPDPDPKYVKSLAPNQEYACKAVVEATAFEDRLDGPTANASSGSSDDRVSLKIARDGKGIFLLFAASVAQGATDAGEAIPITLDR